MPVSTTKNGAPRRASTIDDEDEQPTSLMPRGSSLPGEREMMDRAHFGVGARRITPPKAPRPERVDAPQAVQDAPNKPVMLRPDVQSTTVPVPQEALRRASERIVPNTLPAPTTPQGSQMPFVMASATLAMIAIAALYYLMG
jgi:hypothetical protein